MTKGEIVTSWSWWKTISYPTLLHAASGLFFVQHTSTGLLELSKELRAHEANGSAGYCREALVAALGAIRPGCNVTLWHVEPGLATVLRRAGSLRKLVARLGVAALDSVACGGNSLML